MIPELAEDLRANSIQGAFMIGSTGEGVSLAFEEKKSVMDAWALEQSTDLQEYYS